MRLSKNIFYSFPALGSLAALLLAGCANYDNLEEWVVDDEGEGYLAINLTVGGDNRFASRAPGDPEHSVHPDGGEDGCGRENGQHHENDVENLVVYYYNDKSGSRNSGPGIQGDASLQVHLLVNITEGIEFKATSDPRKPLNAVIKLPASKINNYSYMAGDHFIAIANMPLSAFSGVETLGQLRDVLVENAWTGTGTDKSSYTKFVMSNEQDSDFDNAHASTEDDPKIIKVDIERVAARLDFCIDNNAFVTSSGFDSYATVVYDAKDKAQGESEDSKVGEVHLTHVRPFNVMNEATYLIKRSATPDEYERDKTLIYLQDEANYSAGEYKKFPIVVEPHTWEKSTTTKLPEKAAAYYGDSYYLGVKEKGDSWFTSTSDYRVHVNTAMDGFTSTGVSTNGEHGYKNYYVLDYANENTMEAGMSVAEVTTGYLLRAAYCPDVVYDDADKAEAKTGSVSFEAGNTFWRYCPMVVNYDEHQSVYFENEKAANDYAALHPETPFEIQKYEGGICYYPVYLRHDNGDDANPFTPYVTPMEYGIVRNNIYRLKVSFTGPGYNTIPENPREPLGIKPYIFVRKWYQITHSPIPV